jgi:hypothetical protein
VVPGLIEVAKPWVGAWLLTVAMVRSDDVQEVAGAWVMSPVVWSKNVAVAVNCKVIPTGIEGFTGATEMLTTGFVTVRVAVPVMPLSTAVIVEVAPGVTLVAKPPVVIVAPGEALHVTLDVMSFVLASA